MKWAITVLMILGVVAAVCVSVLIHAMRGERRLSTGAASSEVEVVMVKESLPAMSVVASRHLESRKAPRSTLPQGYISSTWEAVGRVLSVPVVEGQVLTRYCFVSEGTGTQLAAALPHGMRAVSVAIPVSSTMAGLLYPGCVVDILASFKLPGSERGRGQAVSTTLLHGIQVLAVDEISVVSKQDDEEESAFGGRRSGRARSVIVTLMVDSRQAEALQLARDQGSISLAMRNPLDRVPVDSDATVLSEGRLAKLASMLEPSVLSEGDKKERATAGLGQASPGSERYPEYLLRGAAGGDRSVDSPQWPIVIIRGPEIREEILGIPEGVVGR
jgi:pilus assembly protein CpaB